MRLPFKPGLVLGTDIAHATRFSNPDKPDWIRLTKLCRRFMTDKEYTALFSRFPILRQTEREKRGEISKHCINRIGLHVAGRWAAKEAAMKAWNAKLVRMDNIEIHQRSDGCMELQCFLPEGPKDSVTSQSAVVSISHDGVYAMATVLAEPLHPDLELGLKKIRSELRPKRKTVQHAKSEVDERDSPSPEDMMEDKDRFFSTTKSSFDDFIDREQQP